MQLLLLKKHVMHYLFELNSIYSTDIYVEWTPSRTNHNNAASTLFAWQIAGMVRRHPDIALIASNVDENAKSIASINLDARIIQRILSDIGQDKNIHATMKYVAEYENMSTEVFIQSFLAALPSSSIINKLGYPCRFMGSAMDSQQISWTTVFTRICDKFTANPNPPVARPYNGELAVLKAIRSRVFAHRLRTIFPYISEMGFCENFAAYERYIDFMGFDVEEVQETLCQSKTIDAKAELKTLITNQFSMELLGASSFYNYYKFWCQYINVENLNQFGYDGQSIKNNACAAEKAASITSAATPMSLVKQNKLTRRIVGKSLRYLLHFMVSAGHKIPPNCLSNFKAIDYCQTLPLRYSSHYQN